MITKDQLLEIAIDAEQTMNQLRGQPNSAQAFTDSRRRYEDALAAAKWLEEGGLTEIEQIGPFGGKSIKKGDQVIIRKGAEILSFHPKHKDNPKIAGRDYKVVVHRVYEGYMAPGWHPHRRDRHETMHVQQVVWAGEGGYWCHLDTQFVDLV